MWPHRWQPTRLPLSLGFSRQEHWSGLPFLSPMNESEKGKWSHSVVPDSQRPHGLQPARLLCPWDFPGKSTGVGCHCLLCYLKLNHLSSVEHYDETSHWKLERIQNKRSETYGELFKITKWIYVENAENKVTGVLDKNSSDKAHYSNTGYKLQNPWAIKNSWRVYRRRFHVAY